MPTMADGLTEDCSVAKVFAKMAAADRWCPFSGAAGTHEVLRGRGLYQ
jgi:hypothetical protein